MKKLAKELLEDEILLFLSQNYKVLKVEVNNTKVTLRVKTEDGEIKNWVVNSDHIFLVKY